MGRLFEREVGLGHVRLVRDCGGDVRAAECARHRDLVVELRVHVVGVAVAELAARACTSSAGLLLHPLHVRQPDGPRRALYAAFLGMHLASGVPGGLSVLALAYNTSLFGALTHYSSGQAAVYFGGNLCLHYYNSSLKKKKKKFTFAILVHII